MWRRISDNSPLERQVATVVHWKVKQLKLSSPPLPSLCRVPNYPVPSLFPCRIWRFIGRILVALLSLSSDGRGQTDNISHWMDNPSVRGFQLHSCHSNCCNCREELLVRWKFTIPLFDHRSEPTVDKVSNNVNTSKWLKPVLSSYQGLVVCTHAMQPWSDWSIIGSCSYMHVWPMPIGSPSASFITRNGLAKSSNGIAKVISNIACGGSDVGILRRVYRCHPPLGYLANIIACSWVRSLLLEGGGGQTIWNRY